MTNAALGMTKGALGMTKAALGMTNWVLLECLNIDFVRHSWEWDALADVLFAGDPSDGSFDAESEAAVRDREIGRASCRERVYRLV